MARRVYPLSNAEGQPIPTDLLGPVAALDIITVTSSPLVASVALPGYGDIFLEIGSTVDCQIGFTATPVDGITTKGTYHLRADDPRLLFPDGAYISAVATNGEEGELTVNLLNLWEATMKAYQTDVGE